MRRNPPYFSPFFWARFSVLFLAIWPSMAFAETVYDRLFKTGTLNELNAGDVVDYDFNVNLARENTPPQDAVITLNVNDNKQLEIQRVEASGKRFLGTFSQEIGNPMNMYFLEQLIAMIAEETGGSVFYIRNNFKDALIREIDNDIACQGAFRESKNCLVMRPFENDPNVQKLGRFANLQIESVLNADTPAWIVGMEAVLPDDRDEFVYKLEQREQKNE